METGVVMAYWSWAKWGKDTPAAPHASITRPEQSNEFGPAPPHWYGFPICASAHAIATFAFGAGTLGDPVVDGVVVGVEAVVVPVVAGAVVAGTVVAAVGAVVGDAAKVVDGEVGEGEVGEGAGFEVTPGVVVGALVAPDGVAVAGEVAGTMATDAAGRSPAAAKAAFSCWISVWPCWASAAVTRAVSCPST